MFHKAVKIQFREGTVLDVTFADGCVKRYDMAKMFDVYPPLKALEDTKLFKSGELCDYGIIWSEDLDIGTDTIYEDGRTVRKVKPAENIDVGESISYARLCREKSQAELAELSGIDQSDISKLERGVANPSIKTLKKIADALDCNLVVKLEQN